MQELFRNHIRTHAANVGFDMPQLLEAYLVELLTSRLSRIDLIPDPSFGERYMMLLSERKLHDLKDYADQCLFFTSLLPEYGQRRGLSMDYYCTLGISSYYTVGEGLPDDRYIQLGNWFYHLQKFLNSAIHPNMRLDLFHF